MTHQSRKSLLSSLADLKKRRLQVFQFRDGILGFVSGFESVADGAQQSAQGFEVRELEFAEAWSGFDSFGK
jgi:hypothetical protein